MPINSQNGTSNNNVDPDEIEKFSALADDWWNFNGKSKPLHKINPIRLEFILQHITTLHNLNFVDVGCGGGILTESLAQFGAKTTGIDLSDAVLSIARDHANNQNLSIEYINTTVEVFAKNNRKTFDVVTCMEMLEHVPDPSSIIRSCADLLKPRGTLILSTINRNLKSKMMMIYGAEYITNMVPKGTHEYSKFIRPSELMEFVRKAKLTIIETRSISYHLLKDSFYLSDNLDVNYLLCAKKL